MQRDKFDLAGDQFMSALKADADLQNGINSFDRHWKYIINTYAQFDEYACGKREFDRCSQDAAQGVEGAVFLIAEFAKLRLEVPYD